jgi:Cu(I)/Ag(I) efflux system membrane fusion protein
VIAEVVDLSKVWMYAYVYENEMRFLKEGQKIIATTEAYPEEEFVGKIIYVSPQVDVSSRTVRVRVGFLNEDEKLKLDMFMNASIHIELDETIAVPQSAVISTGNRNIVFVKKSEKVFEPRNVTLGVSAENYVQILSGIEEGETVVTSGGYLLDSESQLQMGMGTSEHAQHDNNNNSR